MMLAAAAPSMAANPPPATPAATAAAAAQEDDPDLDVNLAQPDFMLSALPTTLRVPRNKLTFRLTHRFNQPLEDSGLDDLWGMDSGAIIGFEFRYGVIPGGQVGFYRTSDRTIEFFSQYDVVKQGGSGPSASPRSGRSKAPTTSPTSPLRRSAPSFRASWARGRRSTPIPSGSTTPMPTRRTWWPTTRPR